VKWQEGTQNDDVIDERGASPSSGGGGGGYFGGGGMRLGGGGVLVLVIGVIIARLTGVNILGGGGGGSPEPSPARSQRHETSHPRSGPDSDAKLVDFVKFTMKDVQTTFEGIFKADGKPYRHAKLVLFTSEIDTGCGRSSAAIGPFYCPPDEEAYIDLSFYQELRDRFGAPGEFAEAYVLAHEIGHHLQNLLGIEKKSQMLGSRHGRDSASVKLELQADCFAGVWGHSAAQRGIVEPGDLEKALGAASAIGDDRLQKQAGREVNAETWTHGSSEMRVRWFKRGFDSGRLDQCDTFSASQL
jgi:predicted metalloprotease